VKSFFESVERKFAYSLVQFVCAKGKVVKSLFSSQYTSIPCIVKESLEVLLLLQ